MSSKEGDISFPEIIHSVVIGNLLNPAKDGAGNGFRFWSSRKLFIAET